MHRLKSQYCEYYNVTDEECLFSLQWEALLKWMISNNRSECLDLKKGEQLNYELICEFDKWLKLDCDQRLNNDDSV